MQKGAIASVSALCVLGMLGGCLIAAYGEFATSSKRGAMSILVPAPQAYILAAIMFAMSALALVWLLQQLGARARGYCVGAAAYVGVAVVLTRLLS